MLDTEQDIVRVLGTTPQSDFRRRGVNGIVDDPKTATLINFASNSAKLPQDAHAILNEYVKALKGGLRDAVLVIAGHTDNIGSEHYNRTLARQRAQAVKNYLVENGIAQDRLRVEAFGEAHPAVSNETEEGRRLNRRCEFIRVGSLQALSQQQWQQ